MNYSKIRFLSPVLFTSFLSLSALATAPYEDFKFGTPDRIDFWAQAGYSKSDGNFEKSGNTFTKFNSGYGYQTYDFDFGARAEIAPRFHIYASSRLTSAESQTASFGSPQIKTNTGFANATLGSDWVLVSGKILVIPDVSFTVPFEQTERLAGSKVAIGEGVMEGTGRLILRIERRSYRFGGFGGFTYRDGGRSMLLPYGALFELTLGKWNIGTDVRGYQSLSYDQDTDSEVTIDSTYFCPVNGCSKRFAAFNPSSMESNLWLRINATPDFAFHVGAGMNWAGSNVARDATLYGGIIYRWNFGELRQRSAPLNPNFEESVYDGVDQRSFNQVPPKSTNVPLISVAPDEQAPRRKPRRQKENTINLQDELNKTEMQMQSDSVKENED